MKFLSVIIPAFNERRNFERGVLSQVDNYFKDKRYSVEIIVINDGSTDDTRKLTENFIRNKKSWRLLNIEHKGKYQAVKEGIKEAQGELILFTDFDQSTPISEVEKLIPEAEMNFDILIGSREIIGAKREKEPFYRHLMGRGFNLLVRLIVGLPFKDTQCGFKLFRRETIQKIIKKVIVAEKRKTVDAYTGAFDVEILYLANKMGYKVKEIAVSWRHFKTERVSPIKDSLRMFLDILRIKINNLLGSYDKHKTY